MATLKVENVPDALYGALRERAREHRRSITSEVLTLLEENLPTDAEIGRRRELSKRIAKIRTRASRSKRSFASTEEMQRQDRLR